MDKMNDLKQAVERYRSRERKTTLGKVTFGDLEVVFEVIETLLSTQTSGVLPEKKECKCNQCDNGHILLGQGNDGEGDWGGCPACVSNGVHLCEDDSWNACRDQTALNLTRFMAELNGGELYQCVTVNVVNQEEKHGSISTEELTKAILAMLNRKMGGGA